MTVPSVSVGAAALSCSVLGWGPLSAGFDLVRGRKDLPSTRVGSFALGWSVLEAAGVGAATALWATGRSKDQEAHFALQRWWARQLVAVLRQTTNLTFEVDGLEHVAPGPVVICARHASLADALIPMWLLGQADMRPRYVMTDELQLDPCLDIVGNRLPNHFLDRDPGDSVHELAQLERLSNDMGSRDASIIFPEGGVVTDRTRARALAKIEESDPSRFPRVKGLQTLAPVRPNGTRALLRGSPDSDLVLVTHTGLESLQRLVDAPRQIPIDQPVKVKVSRVARSEIPRDRDFDAWFDHRWALLDSELWS